MPLSSTWMSRSAKTVGTGSTRAKSSLLPCGLIDTVKVVVVPWRTSTTWAVSKDRGSGLPFATVGQARAAAGAKRARLSRARAARMGSPSVG